MKRVNPKMPKVPEASFFATCNRDEGGQCLPKGGSGGAGGASQATERGVEGQSRPVKKDKSKDKVEGTAYTVQDLEQVARKAGEALFSKHRSGLVMSPITKVEHYNLSELQKPDEEMDAESHTLDEYEYVFYPSTGKGKDVAGYGWDEAKESWKDTDGNIYTVWGEGVLTVVKPDVEMTPKKKAPREEEGPKEVKEDPNIKVGKFHMGQPVSLHGGRFEGRKPGARIERFDSSSNMYIVRWPSGSGALVPARNIKADGP